MSRPLLYVLCSAAACFLAAAGLSAQEVEKRDTLDSSYVSAVKEKMVNTTQTGLTRIEGAKLRSGIAILGSPDIIKQLQILPGVAVGNELSSGLYVHGGDGADNLFLLDGVPLYNITHFGGLFSSFNTDVVENLDFYKSGFPARYGGRLSSVVDVETSEGNLNEWHGGVSLSLIDGRVHVEGPIIPGKTSVNFGIRRSWLDVITIPALAYVNHENGGNPKVSGGYSMTDLNGRVTHVFSEKSRLNASVYWGRDKLKAGLKQEENEARMELGVGTEWGTLATSLSWNYDYSKLLHSKLMGYYSRSDSDIGYNFDIGSGSGDTSFSMGMSDDNICAVSDAGLKYDWDWFASPSHHLRFGIAGAWHDYRVERKYVQDRKIGPLDPTHDEGSSGEPYNALEGAIYLEDEIFIAYNFTLNVGARLGVFGWKERAWVNPEPRAALKWMISKDLCAKLSYTRMSQYVHLVSAMYIDLPTNSWMPSTSSAAPMISDQVAGGIYFTHGPWTANLEGWYKTMDGMLAYNGANAFYPPLVNWERSFTSGTGKSYGMELELSYKVPKLELSAYYTLGWTWRQFPAWYPDPFYDRVDNRHKINLVATWRPLRGMSVFANWNYHSGNRITLPTHVIDLGGYSSGFLYQAPYNMALPDYHRLDIGAEYVIPTIDGKQWSFNLSIYNVYNHLNAAFAMLDTDENGKYIGMAYGLVPIIPTLGIGLKF